MRLLRLASIAVLLLLLSSIAVGCVPGSLSRSSRRDSAPRPVGTTSAATLTTVTWSFWGEPWEVEINRRVARSFEAEQPTIRVELQHQPWERYFAWLEDRWRRGDAPDVMLLNNVRGYAARGLLAPLDRYLERDNYDLADFYPRLLELFALEGVYHGLPRDNDTKVIFYNRALFAEAGLDPPKEDWDWTALRNLASRLTRRDGAGRSLQYGFAFETEMWWRIWVWQNGGDIFDDPIAPRSVRLDDADSVDALQFLTDLMLIDRVTPPLEVLRSTSKITQLFREGKLAMAFGDHGKVPLLAEEPNLQWDVVGLPARKHRVNLSGGAGYSISATSAKTDAAWLLVRYLESPRGQSLFAESGLIVPARRSVREDSIFLRQQPYDVNVFARETEHGRPNLNIPRANEVNRMLDEAFQPLWRGERSPREIVQEQVPHLRELIRQ